MREHLIFLSEVQLVLVLLDTRGYNFVFSQKVAAREHPFLSSTNTNAKMCLYICYYLDTNRRVEH